MGVEKKNTKQKTSINTWVKELGKKKKKEPRGVGWGGMWEGGLRGREHMYTYGWFMLMYGRNQHNIIKQLSSN